MGGRWNGGGIVSHFTHTCDNCGAKLPENQGGDGPNGAFICCPHCIFNPLGCRCKYGEFGVAETYEDPDFPMFDEGEDAEYDFSDYYEPEDRL